MTYKIIKKDGREEDFNEEKIKKAVQKSADRVNVKFSNKDLEKICRTVIDEMKRAGGDKFPVAEMHKFAEIALDDINRKVAKAYREYRNYKEDFIHIMDDVLKETQTIRYIGDRDNANTDSALVATKRSLIYKKLNREVYQKVFLTNEEREAIHDGYIYIHDMGDRLDTMNCCLFDMATVLKGGFDISNMHYNEPKTLDTAFDVINSVIMMAAAQQYGGFTIPEIDKTLAPYAEKSYKKYHAEYLDNISETAKALGNWPMTDAQEKDAESRAEKHAIEKVEREMEQGVQGMELQLNTVGSSRGDYPFTTVTFGLGKSRWETLASSTFMKVRKGGQGAPGKKKPVLFPKLVFLYDENIHGTGKELEWLFDEAIDCSSKAMYPDYLSMNNGYVGEMYQKYGRVVSPMGCRAYLSPFFEKSQDVYPLDETDKPVFEGRWNGGAISINTPMIYLKSQKENKDFFEVLEYYLQMVRSLHIRTYKYLARQKASVNPLAYTQGGFYHGFLKPDDYIEPLLKYVTFSFGYTALNELQEAYNGKSLYEDGDFAYKTLEYINSFINKYKPIDHIMYAVYGTPAESLATLQAKQSKLKFGIIPHVNDKEYVSNSFHCAVWEDITPAEKQDAEERFFHISNGGHIQYCRYPNGNNPDAIKAIVKRAMQKGFYEGVNIEKNYCNDCGEQFYDNLDECPHCHSKNISQINRVCGYLGWSKIGGDTRINKGKLAEIRDRKSM